MRMTVGSYAPTMIEFPPSLLSPLPSTSTNPTISQIVVDSIPACLSEAGELIVSQIDASRLVELGSLVDERGIGVGRATMERMGFQTGERSLYKSVGVGGMDVAITELIVREAKERGIGTWIEF